MANSYTKAAFCILMSPTDVTVLSAATRDIDILEGDSTDKDLKLSFDALGIAFHAAFPGNGDSDFGSFLEIFDEPHHPTFGCDIDIEEPDKEGRCAVTFSG